MPAADSTGRRDTRAASPRRAVPVPVRTRYLAPVPPRRVTGLAATVRRQLGEGFGVLAPPVWLHAPAPDLLAASWVLVGETLVADGLVDRASKEVVATAVAAGNACPYCVSVHSTALVGLGRPATAQALAAGDLAALPVRERHLATWALSTVTERTAGPRPARALPAGARPAGSGRLGMPELAAVAVTFHYLTRMVEVFLGQSAPPPLPRPGRRLLGRRMTRPGTAPGGALRLLPPASLPHDLSWVAGAGHVADALARAAATVERAATGLLTRRVRDTVLDAVARGDGPRGPSQAWATELVDPLPGRDRAVARLALLTALAPYQVDGRVVRAFRGVHGGDPALLAVTAWASLTAARAAGTRLATTSPAAEGGFPLVPVSGSTSSGMR